MPPQVPARQQYLGPADPNVTACMRHAALVLPSHELFWLCAGLWPGVGLCTLAKTSGTNGGFKTPHHMQACSGAAEWEWRSAWQCVSSSACQHALAAAHARHKEARLLQPKPKNVWPCTTPASSPARSCTSSSMPLTCSAQQRSRCGNLPLGCCCMTAACLC